MQNNNLKRLKIYFWENHAVNQTIYMPTALLHKIHKINQNYFPFNKNVYLYRPYPLIICPLYVTLNLSIIQCILLTIRVIHTESEPTSPFYNAQILGVATHFIRKFPKEISRNRTRNLSPPCLGHGNSVQ